jgi:deoxycytidine triphosphate deaminase
MTVLSETTIRQYLQNRRIIINGNPADVRGSSYSCHALKIIPGGDTETVPPSPTNQQIVIDFSAAGAPQVYRVPPRQLVWVLIRERVRLPENICAFWWQTNSLSRKGLMLVNMSMVDAGYEGSLACLFVNFGRTSVDIDPRMTIARLVFHGIDNANTPYGRGELAEDYERTLRDVALNGPSSFLSLQEFTAAFTTEKQKALNDFTSQARTSAIQVQNEIRDNLPSFLYKSYGIAAAGLALLALAISIAPWIKDRLALDVDKDIAAAVDTAIGKRLQPVATVDADTIRTLDKRIHELETELDTMKAQNSGNIKSH